MRKKLARPTFIYWLIDIRPETIAAGEQKARLIAANRGKTLSREHRAKVGDFHQGKPKTPEQKEKMSISQKARWARRKQAVTL